jgi:squalene-hopene/tetraprenyl-beta-curcumene cyclase
LTAFVTMCMCGAGFREHTATQLGASFLAKNVRADGSWPIDTDLACWVTALSVRALGNDSQQSAIGNWQSLPTANCQLPICNLELTAQIKRNAFAFPHPFTGAKEGGWAWTDLPGAVPDADDTAGALVALHTLSNGKYCYEVGKGIEWLLALQNSDGGMPTFCKGWGKLPFDRSSPDISAHAILAFQLWQNALPDKLQKKCRKSTTQMLRWMHRAQAADGSWTPLWFGDQDAPDERAPVYGTAMATEYLSATSYQLPVANNTLVYPQEFGHWSLVTGKMVSRGLQYLLAAQNADGGWGGAKGIPSKVTFTARALSAIASVTNVTSDKRDMSLVARHSSLITATQRAFDFLHQKYKAGELYRREPIGLYFSRLWYSEELYNISFVLNALKKLEACSKAN